MNNVGLGVHPGSFKAALRDAAGYWEPRRIAYNLMLLAIALGWLALTWPHFLPAFSPNNLFILLVLALLANACYTAAYLIDVPVEFSPMRNLWRRRRWILWWVGMLFAALITFYWIADEIYPYVK